MIDVSDDQNEVFDLIDKNDRVVGKVRRGDAHRDKSLIHRSVGVAVVNHHGKIFLQRRSLSKDVDSMKWTISCSGHVPTGEKYEQAAARELKEELGITGVTLNFLTKYLYQGEKETEMVCLFKIFYDKELTLNTTEILEGKFFSKEELVRAVTAKEIDLNKYGRIALEKLGYSFPDISRQPFIG